MRLGGQFDAQGDPLKKGKLLYHVVMVVGYWGTRPGQVILLGALEKADEHALHDFLRRIPGRPRQVICDGAPQIRNAVERTWGGKVELYPCARHLRELLILRLKRARLWNRRRRIYRLVCDDLLTDPWAWVAFRSMLNKYLRDPRHARSLGPLLKWIERNEANIERALFAGFHYPRTLGGVEDQLEIVRRRLGDRRRTFRNLTRLDCLLTLMALDLRGDCDEAQWARILIDNHERYQGRPPPRRKPIDGKRLLRIKPVQPPTGP